MVSDNAHIDRNIKSAQASITSLSIFVALSVAMIALLVSQKVVDFGYNAVIVSSGSLTLAIVLFLVALEFFILCIYHCEHIDWFGRLGSYLYGLGAMWMVVGISVGLIAFAARELSLLFLSVTFVGYTVYYVLRMRKLGREDYCKTRMIFRGVYLIIVVVGYVFIATVGG